MTIVPLDEIYDAAFDRARLPGMLKSIVQALGGQSGLLGCVDMRRGTRIEVEFGNDPAFLQSYVETYGAHDILRPELMGAPEGQVMHVHARLQEPEVQASVFWREWLAPQRVVDNLAVNLIKREDMFAALAVVRNGDVDPYGPAEMEAMAAIVPHLRRAVYMQARMVRQANLVGGYQRVTNTARTGLVLLDGEMRVVEADPATQAQTGLKVDLPLGPGAFDKALVAAVESGAPTPVTLRGDDGAETMLLLAAQALEPDPFGDLAGGPGATHAVHVVRPDQPPQVAFDSMAAVYGLTPTETKVMADAFAHADIGGVGERLGMAKATTRTHLHRIYDKTGVKSFAALCLLAHRFAAPHLR